MLSSTKFIYITNIVFTLGFFKTVCNRLYLLQDVSEMGDEKMSSESVIKNVDNIPPMNQVSIDSNLGLQKIARPQFKQKIVFGKKQKFQALLAFGAFLTFGVGDSLTSVIMMTLHGPGVEANPLMRYLIGTQGPIGVIMFKLTTTFALLSTAIIIQDKSGEYTYWTTNGFLVAFGIGGILATTSNLMRTFSFDILGYSTPSPSFVIMVYLLLVLGLLLLGGILDKKSTA